MSSTKEVKETKRVSLRQGGMPPAWEALENPDLLLRQMNLDRKRIEKHVRQEEQKRIAQSEDREDPGLAASGMTATPSDPQQLSVLTGLKGLSRSLRSKVSSPFRSNPPTGDGPPEKSKDTINPDEEIDGRSEDGDHRGRRDEVGITRRNPPPRRGRNNDKLRDKQRRL